MGMEKNERNGTVENTFKQRHGPTERERTKRTCVQSEREVSGKAVIVGRKEVPTVAAAPWPLISGLTDQEGCRAQHR